MRTIAVCLGVLLLGNSTANAAPPADCAWKFVGTWQSTFTPNGHQSTAIIKADGTQAVNCTGGGCVSSLKWTCSGDTHIVGSARSKLSPDGKRMTWRLGYSVRLTRVPAGLVGGASGVQTKIDKKKKNTQPPSVGKPELVRANREPGFETCTKFKVSDKDYQEQARLFKQDPPHQWNVLVSASSDCKVPIVFNACFTFHSLKLPEQRGGGKHFIGARGNINVSYYSNGFPRDGRYSYNIRFCQQGKGKCKVSCL